MTVLPVAYPSFHNLIRMGYVYIATYFAVIAYCIAEI